VVRSNAILAFAAERQVVRRIRAMSTFRRAGLIVAAFFAAMASSVVARGTESASDDVPAKFAYTKTPKYRQFLALVEASKKGSVRSVKALLRRGVDGDGRDVGDGVAPMDRPLAVAAEHGHLDVVKVLLAAGASPDWCCCSCVTALHYAIKGGYAKIVARLLDAGADPGIPYDGELPTLELARRSGNPEIVRLVEERLTRR
jgi:Ankyrin repeats (3 copies)